MERIGKIQAYELYNGPTRSTRQVNAESHKPSQHAFQHNFTNYLQSNALHAQSVANVWGLCYTFTN
jgi:hypothetical protein